MSDEIPDSEIARRIRGGETAGRAAEDTLCKRFAPRIRLYGLRHLGVEAAAADLVQVVLMRVLEALRAGCVENTENLAAYVHGTCRYATLDLRRTEKRQRAIEASAVVLAEVALPPSTSARDFVRLFGCLQSLPERDNQIVRMSFMEERSADEIAQRMSLSAGNVRVIRHRAIARLHLCIEGGAGL
ncbi:MAG TPA: sigma-70 family RNA polymerase sigma factor [Polyangiaceae bacterium]|nr:sigma-70 family RNA polymerase sigma factor [Polyangiaceae bacterium]